MSSRFEETKRLYVGIRHVMDSMPRESHYNYSKLGQDVFELTGATRFRSRDRKTGEYKTCPYISELMHGHRILSDADGNYLKDGLLKIINKYDLETLDMDNMPISTLTKYERELREKYGDDGNIRLVPWYGQNFGVYAQRLKGMWRFFYLPPDDLGKLTIVTNVVFFYNSGADDKTVDGILFVGDSQPDGPSQIWNATATINRNNHLQIMWYSHSTGETSYMLTTLPEVPDSKIVGISTFLQQTATSFPKIISTIGFASKCRGVEEELAVISDLDDGDRRELRDTLSDALDGNPLTERQQRVIRRHFRVDTLSISDFGERYPDILTYLHRMHDFQRILMVRHGWSEILQPKINSDVMPPEMPVSERALTP